MNLTPKDYCNNWITKWARHDDTSVVIDNKFFEVFKDIFLPIESYSTEIIVNNFPECIKNKKVLDMGTGAGILAILLALKGAKQVIAVDIDIYALENAKKNASEHKVSDAIIFKDSNLFDSLNCNEKFDLIVANLPIKFTDENLQITQTFIKDLDHYLNKGGKAYLSHASFGYPTKVTNLLYDCSLDFDVVKEKKFGVDWFLYIIHKE